MTPVQNAASPSQILYRIGRLPNPLAWPPRGLTGAGRFDDPLGQFSTLYAAEQRRACFIESLARFRASPKVLAELRRVSGTSDTVLSPSVPLDWCAKRGVARFYLRAGQRWLDLRSIETREALRTELAELLVNLNLADLDAGEVLSPNRQLTQAISRWAYERGYNGIAYKSRLDDDLDCWALFQGASIEMVGSIEPISPHDPDFREAATLFGLVI
ncbi:MAG TPA: RES family NAD+ phosphorylase [Chloroflexota bacterium]|nr:RES family NAD+ phosphorylase [Chloroflexota bacterium]